MDDSGVVRRDPSSRVLPFDASKIRYISKIVDGVMRTTVSVAEGKESWLELDPSVSTLSSVRNTSLFPSQSAAVNNSNAQNGVFSTQKEKRDVRARCAVPGCEQNRKYRSIRKFELGGCSLNHLQLVEADLKGV
jgi:hypothetical protein